MKVYVNVLGHEYDTSEADANDPWDRPNTEFNMDTLSVSAVKDPNAYWGVSNDEFDLDVEVGDTVYVLCARYSSGDTFGYDDGLVYIVDVFVNKDWAYAVRDVLQQSPGFSEVIDGKNYYIPWNGYFERLEDLDVREEIVRKK